MQVHQCEVGVKYKVTYRLDTQRVPRQMVAVFIAREGQGTDTVWSGRPEFGTTHLLHRTIIDIERCTPAEAKGPCYADRRA